MKICPTCGCSTINRASTFTMYPDGLSVGGAKIPLTKTEVTIVEILQGAMGRGPVFRGTIIDALYNIEADEPPGAERTLKVFIFNLRKKLEGTNLSIENHYDFGYSLVYEARKAA